MKQLIVLLSTLFLLAGCASQTALPPQNVALLAEDIAFNEQEIKANLNQPIELKLTNKGVIDHAFVIDGLVEPQTIKPNAEQTFTFTPSQIGQFKYYCSIPGHDVAGMNGVLIVTQ
jgi:heme/copper-type cytochrome/quinol oxidase subunit 2